MFLAKRGGGGLDRGYPQALPEFVTLLGLLTIIKLTMMMREEKKMYMFSRDGAPGLKPSFFQIRYENISLRYYDNPERSCAGVYKIETHA